MPFVTLQILYLYPNPINQSPILENRQPPARPNLRQPLDAPHILPTRRTPLTARGRPPVQNENIHAKISLLILVSKPKRNTTIFGKYVVFIRKESYQRNELYKLSFLKSF